MIESAGLSFEERQQVKNLYAGFDPPYHSAVDRLFKGLNREQVAALSHPLSDGKPLLIIAGAGSGKTSVLTRRVALLMISKIDLQRIFISTFTLKAAAEIKDRVGKLIDDLRQEATGRMKTDMDEIFRKFPHSWFGTFHALCLRLLKEKNSEGFSPVEELGYPPELAILSDAESKKMIQDVAQDLPVQPAIRNLAAAIDLAANELLTPDAVAKQKTYGGVQAEIVAAVWTKYSEVKRAAGMVDFTDLLYLAASAFADRRMAAEGWRKKFSHILIDEYQDTNIAQYAIATELAAAQKNLFVVGDDDQSIYGFRGADVRNIRVFGKDYPDARVIRLVRNYRSTPIILGAANAVLAGRPESSTDKTLLAEAPEGAVKPEKIVVYEAGDERDEINFVIFQIRELLNEGFQYKDIVIFYRVHELSETAHAALRAQQIPAVEVSGKSIMDNDVVKSLAALFRAVNVLNLKREGSFNPVRDAGVLRAALREIWTLETLGPKNRNDRDKLLSLAAPERILLDEQGYVEAAQMSESGETQQHLEKLWTGLHGGAESMPNLTPRDLADFLMDAFGLSAATGDKQFRTGIVMFQRFLSSRVPFAAPGRAGLDLLLTSFHSAEQGEPIADLLHENVVRLLTIHASKGLEFPVVFVIGVEEDILPFVHLRSAETESEAERLDREEEELRLFYVAITRAKHRLILTSAARRIWYGNPVSHTPSRFLAKLPANLVIRGSALSPLDHAAHRTKQFFKDMFSS